MGKTELVRARIKPNLKSKAEAILRPLGIGHSSFITMSYQAIVDTGTVPNFMISDQRSSSDTPAEGNHLIKDTERSNSNASDAIENFITKLSQSSQTK